MNARRFNRVDRPELLARTVGESNASTPAQAPERRTILIAEDNRTLRTSLELGLSYRGFRVLAACDGSEAFELFRTSSTPVDLVLSDVNMPILDGPQLLNALRASTGSLRFCFMTGDSRPRNLSRLRSLGALEAFSKPFPSIAQLADELWRLSSSRSEDAPTAQSAELEPDVARRDLASYSAPSVRPSIARRWASFLRMAVDASARPSLRSGTTPRTTE